VQVVFVPFERKANVGARVGIGGIEGAVARNVSGVLAENTGTGAAAVGSALTGSEVNGSETIGSEVVDCMSSWISVLDGSTVMGSDATGVYNIAAGVVVLGGGSFVVGSTAVRSTGSDEEDVIGGSLVATVVVGLLSAAPSGTASALLPPSTGTVS
jgi:hypothetical protein